MPPRQPFSLRVAVAAVVKQDEVLVVARRTESVAHTPKWQFPAGIIKPGADPRRVAMDETLAETGVYVTYALSLGERLHPMTSVYCSYHLCEYAHGGAFNCDPVENVAVRWVRLAKLSELIPERSIYPPLLAALDEKLFKS